MLANAGNRFTRQRKTEREERSPTHRSCRIKLTPKNTYSWKQHVAADALGYPNMAQSIRDNVRYVPFKARNATGQIQVWVPQGNAATANVQQV
jgi:hypothetical protein